MKGLRQMPRGENARRRKRVSAHKAPIADEPFRTGEPNPHPCEHGEGRHILYVC